MLQVGMENGTDPWGDSLSVPEIVKHRVPKWPCNSTPRAITKENQSLSTLRL